jgi:IS605 OrfB family transposase
MEVKKTLRLNLLPLTKSKRKRLREFKEDCLEVARFTASVMLTNDPRSSTNLHHLTYADIRRSTGLHSQVIQDIRRTVWGNRKTIGRVGRISPSFNIPRSGGFSHTGRGNPVFTIAIEPDGRIALPVAMDGAYRRFEGHLKEGWRFSHFKLNGRQIHVCLRKEFEVQEGRNVLGVDIGTQVLSAITIYNPAEDKVLRQLYLGQDLYAHKRNLCIHRSKLQARADKGSRRARRALREFKAREYNLDKTRCYQVAHEIVRLAEEHDATVAIEDLNGLKDSRLNRRANRKVKRTPYHLFKEAIQQVAWQNGIAVRLVDPKNTSKACPRCGHVSRNNRKGQALFHCINCGYEVNADRNASYNIATRAVSMDQVSGGRAAVNRPLRRHEGVVEPSHGLNPTPERKPRTLVREQFTRQV